MSLLHVLATSPCYKSLINIPAACPCNMSLLQVPVSCPCNMSPLHVPATCPSYVIPLSVYNKRFLSAHVYRHSTVKRGSAILLPSVQFPFVCFITFSFVSKNFPANQKHRHGFPLSVGIRRNLKKWKKKDSKYHVTLHT